MNIEPRADNYPAPPSGSLADVLERVLDKGVVIAGDIVVNIVDIELLSLKLRLVIASVDTATQMGMTWWANDPFFSGHREEGDDGDARRLEAENRELRERLERLEQAVAAGRLPVGEPAAEPEAPS